jgi:uncharacterized damage-inducible protein DinB
LKKEHIMKLYSKFILAAAFAGCCSVYAQSMNTIIDEARQSYDRVKNNVLEAAEKMPEQDYSFQPTPDIRTFGKLVAHIADAQAHFCSAVDGTNMQLHAASRNSKADLIAALKESNDECDKAYASVNDSNANQSVGGGRLHRSKLGMLYLNVAHDNEEYGYMAVYLRLKGIVPPTSSVHAVPVK